MISQGPFYQKTRVVDDQHLQEIKDLYRKLNITSEESEDQSLRGFRDYWPPIPEYSVRYCTNEDLNYAGF